MPTISRAWKAGTAVGDHLGDWLLAGETLHEMPRRRKRRLFGVPLLFAAILSILIVGAFVIFQSWPLIPV